MCESGPITPFEVPAAQGPGCHLGGAGMDGGDGRSTNSARRRALHVAQQSTDSQHTQSPWALQAGLAWVARLHQLVLAGGSNPQRPAEVLHQLNRPAPLGRAPHCCTAQHPNALKIQFLHKHPARDCHPQSNRLSVTHPRRPQHTSLLHTVQYAPWQNMVHLCCAACTPRQNACW